MITVTIKRDAHSSKLRELTVSGHAFYDEYGKDIVCAAVSAVTINMINAVEALLHVRLETEQRDGFIACRVPELEHEVAQQVQLLLEALVYSLTAIRDAYPEHVTIKA